MNEKSTIFTKPFYTDQNIEKFSKTKMGRVVFIYSVFHRNYNTNFQSDTDID